MSATLTLYRGKHRGQWSHEDYLGGTGHTARHAHDYCRRCSGDTTAPAKCPPCVAEVARVRAEMRRELADFIADDDGRDSGRAL